MGPFNDACENQQTAQISVLLIKGNIMPGLSGNTGCFHSARATADNHDLFGVRRLVRNTPFRHSRFMCTHMSGIHAAMLIEIALLIVVKVAVHAAGAGSDLITAVFFQLLSVFRIRLKRTGEKHKVAAAILQRIREVIGETGRIQAADRANRDGNSTLELLSNIQHQAVSAMVSSQLALEVTAEIELCAVTGCAIDPIAGEIHVCSKLCNMLSARSDADMKRSGTGILKNFADGLIFGNSRHQIVLADVLIHFLNSVDEYLNGEIISAFFMDLLNHFNDKTCSVLRRVRTILVRALIAVTGEESLTDIVTCRVYLNCVKSMLFQEESRIRELLNDGGNLVLCQVLCLCAGELLVLSRIKTAVLSAHLAELIADIATCIVDCSGDLFQMLFAGLSCENLIECRVFAVKIDKVLYPDERNAVAHERAVLIRYLFRRYTGKIVGTCGGFDQFAVNSERTELPGFKEF